MKNFSKDKFLKDLSRFKQTLVFVWRSGPKWSVIKSGLLVIQSILPLLSLYLMKLVVDSVAAGLSNADKTSAFNEVLLYIALFGILGLLIAICNIVEQFVNETQQQLVVNYISDLIHSKSNEIDLEYYDNSKYHDTFHRAQQEASYRPLQILNSLSGSLQSGLSLTVISGLLVSLHWIIVVLLFVTVIPGVIVKLKYIEKLYDWERNRTSTARKAIYFSNLQTFRIYAKEMRIFNLGNLFKQRFKQLVKQLFIEKYRITIHRSRIELLARTFEILAVIGTYAFVAHRTVSGAITLGSLVMYFQAFQKGQNLMQSMLKGLTNLYNNKLFLNNLFEFLEIKRKIVDPPQPQPIPHLIQEAVVFKDVNFQYPSGTRRILNNISLTIKPGETIAIVGENGAGKTTLIKLLCRLYDCTGGNIFFDGTDITNFTAAALREKISVIFQDYVKYDLDARENIRLGNIKIPTDDELIIKAAGQSGADKVINGLPGGYENILGKYFEDGEELSAGQWQKIALARVFYSDAQIIVLDEPTNSIDPLAEYEFFQRLKHLSGDKIIILISHRLSNVKIADRIYMMKKGEIIEQGSHEELVRLDNKYSEMFKNQII